MTYLAIGRAYTNISNIPSCFICTETISVFSSIYTVTYFKQVSLFYIYFRSKVSFSFPSMNKSRANKSWDSTIYPQKEGNSSMFLLLSCTTRQQSRMPPVTSPLPSVSGLVMACGDFNQDSSLPVLVTEH